MNSPIPNRRPHFIVASVGTRGDLYPMLSIAKTLQARGHKVTFFCAETFRDVVHAAGLSYHMAGTQKQYYDVLEDPEIWHPRKGILVLWRKSKHDLHLLRQFVASLPDKQDAIVIAHPMMAVGASLARAECPDLKVVSVYLAPSNLRTLQDPLMIGPYRIPRWWPNSWRRWFWWLAERPFDAEIVPDINRERASLGLAPIEHFLAHIYSVADLSVTLFPTWFAQHNDWPQPILHGDFQFFEPLAEQALAPKLVEFLAAGEPPIVFTPGTGHLHAKEYFAHALAAVQQLGKRAIFLTQFAQQVPANLPPTVLWLEYAAFQTLLPQVALLVHHGGIGSTAEALRAGIAQLVLPFAYDQFDNGARITQLGVGAVLPAKKANGKRLAKQLNAILTSEEIRQQCRQMAKQDVQSPDALCQLIEEHLGVDLGKS